MGMAKTNRRCVIVGGADIGCYERIKGYLRDDDYLIYCDCGLRHMDGLCKSPSLVIGDFDSHENPHLDIETIVLPVAKDDTDTVYAAREGRRRGFTDFLLLGVFGSRMDHTLFNTYLMFDLEYHGCNVTAVDDYSEFEVISAGNDGTPGKAFVEDRYPFFSLINMTGVARGVTIKNARFGLEDGEITSNYQYATSNEVLPGKTSEITIREGKLLLIKDI